ncbi:MAG: hypothetical protein NC080_06005 [Paraprevotella sp.]|nr:hypothetical protein [Paraprevotella sp.]
MAFNIYYINYPKVYEIKMMFDNFITVAKEVQNNAEGNASAHLGAKMGLGFLKLFSGEGNADINVGGSASKKVLETIEVKTTKSIILSDVVGASKNIKQFDNTIKEGELILIDNVRLSLENEVELRTVKLFTSGAFKNLSVPGANGFDITNLFNSMFKDYAYKIKGLLANENDKIIIKIPVTFENEFESSYNVDDLFIGKVSVLGIYKGTVNIDQLGNTFQYFAELGNVQSQLRNTSEFEEIQESQYPINQPTYNAFVSSGDNSVYHYIDLLAVIQNIHSTK